MMTPPMPEPLLTVGQVAHEAGVADSAVRFYEKHGLLRAHRTSGNQRRFSESAPCRIKVARVAQRIGMTINEIRDLLAGLPDDRKASEEEWARLYDALILEGERRVAQLQSALADIATTGRLCEVPLERTSVGSRLGAPQIDHPSVPREVAQGR